MNPQKITFDISRCFLSDNRSTLQEDIYQKLHGYLRSRDIARLATCTTLSSPALSSLDQYKTLMQMEAFFKKNKSFSDDEVCRQAAKTSFQKGELQCRITNRRLDHYFVQRGRLDPDLDKWMTRMERDIHSILGEYGTFLEAIPKLVRVTAGATSTKSRRDSLPFLRVSKKPYATPSAVPYLNAISEFFGYGTMKVKETLANRVEFVPKNWKTHRSIACEPEGNVFLQLAFDSYCKRRLRRIGVNLADQSRNQSLAKHGSISGDLSTVDMSMASDTLAFNAVAWLLPVDWFDFVNAVRSPRARGEVSCEYAKFSSMGNGCTFSLESLVFASACRAVGSKVSCVYGDDIIIETHLLDDLTKLLRFLGFSINADKTHSMGPFRESCGANWYLGRDITPVYVRDIDRRKAMLCHIVNSLLTICYPGEKLWAYLISFTKNYKLPFVPFNENTTSGVWVNTPAARSLGLIRNSGKHRYQPKMKSYSPVAHQGFDYGSRSLFLWYLDTLESGRPPVVPPLPGNLSRWYQRWYDGGHEPGGYICRSRYTTTSHRFRRKWVHWREPTVCAPVQLDSWSDYWNPLH